MTVPPIFGQSLVEAWLVQRKRLNAMADSQWTGTSDTRRYGYPTQEEVQARVERKRMSHHAAPFNGEWTATNREIL